MAKGFSVTYEVITPESAEHGDAAERGFLLRDVTLREALDEMGGAFTEADECPVTCPRWFTEVDAKLDYRAGAETRLSLHLPEHLTCSTRMRIARLANCYGVTWGLG